MKVSREAQNSIFIFVIILSVGLARETLTFGALVREGGRLRMSTPEIIEFYLLTALLWSLLFYCRLRLEVIGHKNKESLAREAIDHGQRMTYSETFEA